MIYLFLSILMSSLINVIFRIFNRFDIDNQQAITFNYITCVFTGLIADQQNISLVGIQPTDSWFWISILLGFMFPIVFIGMAITARKDGISVAAVASKMGVVFPVVFASIYLGEKLPPLLILGIILSIVSVFLTSRKNLKVGALTLTLIPILVFIGSGTIDTTLKLIEIRLTSGVSESMPVMLIFASAGFFGLCIWFYRLVTKKSKWDVKHLIAGIVLGIPNYFSIYFLFMALRSDLLQTAQIFPVNNVGIVLLSTLLSLVLFKEKLSRINILGLGTAVIAILLISNKV
jgi:drug/metabolite transporter (DMT)-like permease